MWVVVILIHLVCRAYAVEAGEDEAIRLISINGDLRLHDIEFLEMQSSILARRAQIEQTTGTLLELINRKQVSRSKVYSSGPISYGQRGASDWSYEAYLVTSIKHILARERQFFDACHVQDQGRLPVVACSMPVHRKTLCAEKNSEDYLVSIYPRLHSDFIVVGNATDDFEAIKAILHSNCGEHESAQKLALQLTEKYPTNAFYKYILSEILARRPRDSLYFAINQIDAAIKLSPSVLAYREHRLMLLLRVQRSKATLDDASWIRKKAEHHLKDIYCSYCARNRVRKPVGLVSWRPWFVLGLFDLISLNGTQAERDFTIALDLASEVGSGGGFPISDSVSHMLRHLKAIAQHHNNEFQDAMETAILNAHANPSALDAVLLISETLARASHYERSLSMLNLALPLMDAYSATPPGVAFIEIITDAPTIKRMSLQLRATVHYRLGDILEAESDAQACLELMPLDALCSYVKTLCMLVTGRFVDAVKSSAPVLSRWFDFKVRKSPEFIQLSYIKEWTRYLHQRVTRSMGNFHWLNDLSDLFKQSWIQSTPLEALVGYVDQPGIQAELPEYLKTPHQIMAILTGNSTDRRTRHYSFDQSTSGSFYNCPSKPFMWQHERRECQQTYLTRLAQILCKLETTYGLILNPGFITISPAMQPFNRRHRLSLVLGSLYSAELIRNYWCQRRRVAFGTCWSFNPDRDIGSEWRTRQFATYNDPLSEDGGDWGQSGYCSAHIPSASAHFHRGPCRSVRDEGPDWFVHTSFITQLLMLADPSETPPIWYANDRSLQIEDRSNYHSPHLFWTGAREHDRNAEHKPRPSFSPAEEESENGWTDASFRDQHYFIKHGMVQAESMTYTPAALQMMYSLMTLRALVPSSSAEGCDSPSSGLSDDTGLGSDLMSAFSRIVDSHSDVHQGVRRSFNVTSKQRLTQSLNQAWQNAQQCGLLNYANKLALSIYAPGRADRSSSASSDSSNRRYLAALLLFEKDADRNFALSVLSLSNRRHREDLGEEMDTAFHDFLIQGEKALATVLAGSNTQLGTRHVTSPFQDHYLNNAINSAFHWLYYWTILKPIASVYSFHIGFSMVLGMLRALGVEPKSALPDAERNLELEAIFIGSPEAFANLCSNILNLSWLSQTSASFTWLMVPSELLRTPKEFIELLNLQAVSNCELA